MEDSCFYVKWHGIKITCLLIIDLWLKFNICLLESVLRKTNDFFITLTILRIKYLKGVHVLGLQFPTESKFFRAASGWQEYLFTFNGWENASVFHRKKCILRFLTINIYGHMGVATSILRLRLSVQKLKSKRNHWNTNNWNTNWLCNKTSICPLLLTNFFVRSSLT